MQTHLGMKREVQGASVPSAIIQLCHGAVCDTAWATFHNPENFSGSQRGQRCRIGSVRTSFVAPGATDGARGGLRGSANYWLQGTQMPHEGRRLTGRRRRRKAER